MKRISIAFVFLLIPLCCIAFAALTKTTAIDEVDAWQKVPAGTLVVGAAGDISGSYSTLLYFEIAYADTDAQDGVDVRIEVSYGDDDWTLLTGTPFTTPARGGQAATNIVGGFVAGETVIELSDATNEEYDTPGQKWFIEEGVEGNSESVRTKSADGDDVTICQDLLRNHGDLTDVWAIVHDYVIPVPTSFAFVRVTVNNTDANADIFWTNRVSVVSSL